MREFRLGDVIDDYCVKCRRIMNHSVVSMMDTQPAKVRCRTCHNDHDYRHEIAPPPKVDPRKSALFKEVLEKLPAAAVPEKPADVPAKSAAASEKAAAAPQMAEMPEKSAAAGKAVKKTRKK